MFLGFHRIHKKAAITEFFCNKTAGPQYESFSVIFAKLLKSVSSSHCFVSSSLTHNQCRSKFFCVVINYHTPHRFLLTLISVNSKVNSKVLSICVNMLKHADAPTHLLCFTIFWCIFIVYTLINGLIQRISSIISSSSFTSNKYTLISINSKAVLACP